MEENVPVALLESILKNRPGSDKYQIREILFGLGYSYTTRQINRALYGSSDRFHSAKGIGAAPLWHLYPPGGQDPSSAKAELKTLFLSHSPTSPQPTPRTPAVLTPIIASPSSGVPSTTKPNSLQPIPQVPAEPGYNKGLEEVRKRKWLREMSRASGATWFLSSNLVTQELLRDIRAQIELGVDDDDDDDNQVELGDETDQMSWRDEREENDTTDDQDET